MTPNIGISLSNLPYLTFYPAQKLSSFASECSRGERSKVHYIWIIPTQIICSLISIPICLVAGAISFVASIFFGVRSKMTGENKNEIEDRRLKEVSQSTQSFEEIHRNMRWGLNESPSSSYSLEEAKRIKDAYNQQIKDNPFLFDAADANCTSCMDSLVFSVRLVGQIFYPPLNANYSGISRDTLFEYSWDPRSSL